MTPYAPKYIPPKQAAEDRARLWSRVYWAIIAIPLVFFVLAFGYSDQAPAFLRTITIWLDRSLGFPILWLISVIAG